MRRQYLHSPLSLHYETSKRTPNCRSSTPFCLLHLVLPTVLWETTMRWMHFITFRVIDVDKFSLFCNSQHVLAFKWSRSTLEEKSFALLDFSSNRGEEWIGKETEIKSFLASPPPRHFAFFEAARIVTERVRWREGDGYRWIFQATDSENIMMSVEIPSQAMSSSSLLFPRRRLISLSEGNENHLFSPILRDDLKFCRDRLVPGHPAAWLSSSLNNLFNYRIPSPWKAFLKLARRRRLWNMANFKSWRETY